MRVEDKMKVMGYKKNSLGSMKTRAFSTFSKGPPSISSYSLGAPTSPPISRNWGARSPESQASVHSPQSSGQSSVHAGEIRRLTEKELQEKRAKGLCYRCDSKWGIGYRCKKKELSVMLIEEEDGDLKTEDSDNPPSPVEEIATEVSLNSVIGLSNPRTMKLRGLIGEYEVVVMIDPGATHNFIALNTVKEAGVPITGTGGFGVSLGNGEAIRGEGMCKNVRLQLDGGVEVIEDFLPLQLGSSDVILGIQWLEKLGMILTKLEDTDYEVRSERGTGDASWGFDTSEITNIT